MPVTVKQPNGLYALYSHIEDKFLDLNLTQQDIISSTLFEEGFIRGREIAQRGIERADTNSNLWGRCLAIQARTHGQDDYYEEVVRLGTQGHRYPESVCKGQIWAYVDIRWSKTTHVMPASELVDVEVLWPMNETEICVRGSYLLKFVRHNFLLRQSDAWMTTLKLNDPALQQYLTLKDQEFSLTVKEGSTQSRGVVVFPSIPNDTLGLISQDR